MCAAKGGAAVSAVVSGALAAAAWTGTTAAVLAVSLLGSENLTVISTKTGSM